MRQTPVLILAYNRADKVRALIDSLRPLAPQTVMVAVDGPRAGREGDAERVAHVQSAVESIDWTGHVHTRFRPTNLGLRRAVVDAVSWAVGEFGQAIVIEEDVVVGPQFVDFATAMLERFRDDERIAHISGYNVVPPSTMRPGVQTRLSLYPESIAWATWDRAWQNYDDDLTWALSCSVGELAAVLGSRWAAVRWKQNFRDAQAQRISTWAYRWIASMWSQRQLVLSPNANLVTYAGADDGTHTTLKQRWEELPVLPSTAQAWETEVPEHDRQADDWVDKVVFGGTPFGVLKGAAVSAVLHTRHVRKPR